MNQKKKKGEQYVKALHIEVPRDRKESTYRMLNVIFGSSSTIKLLGRDLRMTPVITADTTSHQKEKINHLIEKQRKYLNNISTAISYDLGDIDYVSKSLNITMRTMIMNIESVDNSTPLFLSIDYNDYSGGYVLTFPEHKENEARDYIAQLPSFLHWLYGDDVLELLTDYAVERAHAAPWSEEHMRAISQEDTALDMLLDEANKFAWLRDDKEVIFEAAPEVKPAVSAFLFQRAHDGDSVSTFHPKKKSKTIDDQDSLSEVATNVSMDIDKEAAPIVNLYTPILPANPSENSQSDPHPSVGKSNPSPSDNDVQHRQAVPRGSFPEHQDGDSGVSL